MEGERPTRPRPTEAVLCDRDGTLVVDVPYNGDPDRVVPLPTVAQGLARLRSAGIALAVISNQSGIARGLLSERQVIAVNRRVSEVLGPFDAVLWCPHGPDDGCPCRKPAPGLVQLAAERLDVAVDRCTVIGDIGADVRAAAAAGAAGVLVPTPRTLAREVRDAPTVARDFAGAVDHVLAGRPRQRLPRGVRHLSEAPG